MNAAEKIRAWPKLPIGEATQAAISLLAEHGEDIAAALDDWAKQTQGQVGSLRAFGQKPWGQYRKRHLLSRRLGFEVGDE